MLLLQLPVMYFVHAFPGKPIDESFGLIEQLGLETLVNSGDWKGVEDKVLQLPADDLTRVINGLCKQENLVPKVEAYLNTPPSEFQDVLAGNFYTIRAWDIRSGAWAKEVNDDQWEGFFKHLNLAAERLNRSYESEALFLEGNAQLIRVYMGLSEKEDCIAAYNQCQEVDPDHYLSHIAMHRVLTPRWGGSIEEMIDFGNSIKNDHLRGLIQLANLVDIYSDMSNEDEDEEEEMTKDRFRKQHKRYLDQVMSEIEIPTGDSMLAIDAKNHMACVASLLGWDKRCKQYIKELNGKTTFRPWCYFGMQTPRAVKLYNMVGLI